MVFLMELLGLETMSTTIRTNFSDIFQANIDLQEQDNAQEIKISLSFIGSYESMLEWRQKYITALSSANLRGSFRVALYQVSRTWYLDVFFSDARDALFFKLTWV